MYRDEGWYEQAYVDTESDKFYENTTTRRNDPVNSPVHYTNGGIEAIDYIRSKLSDDEWRGYIKGNVLKYVSRERHKGGLEDLRKASWYLNKYIGSTCESDTVSTADVHITSSTNPIGLNGTTVQKPSKPEGLSTLRNEESMTEQRELDERGIAAIERTNELLGILLQQNDYMIKRIQKEDNTDANQESR